jgi:uncharacterized protein YjdB
MRSPALQATLAVLLLAAMACGTPGEPGNPDPSTTFVPVQGVKVTPQVIQFSAIGETRQLSAAVSPSNATDRIVVWETTDPTIATVDAGGLVTAKAAGVGVFITAYTHEGRHQASANVSVDPSTKVVPVEGVKVTPQVIQFSAIGETRQLAAVISPSNATDQAIVWESTDSAVATVDAFGLVTAKAAGVGVFITAYTHDGRYQASVNVSVNP